MRINIPQRDTLELAFLTAVGITIAILGVLFIDEIPYIDFPYNLNTFFWSLGFITLGLFPAISYLSPNRNPRTVSISLFVFGGGLAVLAPVTGAVGTKIYWNGINPLLFVIVFLVSVPITQYVGRAKEYLLMVAIGLLTLLYLFVTVYLLLAFITTQNALTVVPLIGATFVLLGVVATLLNEYQRAGLRRIEI